MADILRLLKSHRRRKEQKQEEAVVELDVTELLPPAPSPLVVLPDPTKSPADLSPRVFHFDCVVLDKLQQITVTVLENSSGSWESGNGATVWDCSIALTGYLAKHEMKHLTGKRGIELGAGLGLTSMTLAKLGAVMVASERPLMTDLLHENCVYNSHRQHESLFYQYNQAQKIQGGDADCDIDAFGAVATESCKGTTTANAPVVVCPLLWGCAHALLAAAQASASVHPSESLFYYESSTGPDQGLHLHMQRAGLSDRGALQEAVTRTDMTTTTSTALSPYFDFFVASDCVFPHPTNRACWPDLADTIAALLRPPYTAQPQPQHQHLKQPHQGQQQHRQHPPIDPPTHRLDPAREPVVGWIAYEPREDHVFGEFFDTVLAARHVTYKRVYDTELIPGDLYVLKLQAAEAGP